MRMEVSGGSHQENSGPSRSSNAITLWETVPRVDQKVRKVANGTERKLQVKKKKKSNYLLQEKQKAITIVYYDA